MARGDNPEFDEAMDEAKAAHDAGRLDDCINAADRALSVTPNDCFAASTRIKCQRKKGERDAQEACRWGAHYEDTCRWSRWYRGEHAWSIYFGWLKLRDEPQVLGRAYSDAREAIRRILNMTNPNEDQFVRNRATLRFLELATKDDDWQAIIEITDKASGDEFDRVRPERTQQLPIPESDYEKWVRRRTVALRHVGREDEALALAQVTSEAHPGNLWLDREHGLCECAAGEHVAGARRLERVYSGRPDFYIAAEVGDCYAAAGDRERAANWYSKAALRTTPPFAINVILKLAVLLEEIGHLPQALRLRMLVWATATDRQWEARANAARNEIVQFLRRHADELEEPADLPAQAPRMRAAQDDCRSIFEHWRAWTPPRPPGRMRGKIARYSPGNREGDIAAEGRRYSFGRDDFQSADDPVYDQAVEFTAAEGPEKKLLAGNITPL